MGGSKSDLVAENAYTPWVPEIYSQYYRDIVRGKPGRWAEHDPTRQRRVYSHSDLDRVDQCRDHQGVRRGTVGALGRELQLEPLHQEMFNRLSL